MLMPVCMLTFRTWLKVDSALHGVPTWSTPGCGMSCGVTPYPFPQTLLLHFQTPDATQCRSPLVKYPPGTMLPTLYADSFRDTNRSKLRSKSAASELNTWRDTWQNSSFARSICLWTP